MRLTHKRKILNLLKEHEWVASDKMEKQVGWRFSARLYDLRKEGYRFFKKPHPFKNKIELWKLAYIPEHKKEPKKELLKMTRQEQMELI